MRNWSEWSARDVAVLGGAKSTRDAASVLGRSYRSVRNKWFKLGLGRRPETLEQRFWAMVEKGDGCWLWKGSVVGMGKWFYGHIKDGGRWKMAHRVSWEMASGRSVPDGMRVLHMCDVTRCVRPDHLFLGTDKDNSADRDAKGRGARLKGEANSQAVLMEADVRGIRLAYALGGVRQRDLAAKYGISQIHVSQIVTGKIWKHLEVPE